MTEDMEDSRELDRIKFAPRAATREEYSHAHAFQDLDGSVGLSYWHYRFDVRPSLSFQVYVIYEASTQHEDMVALAESLYKEIYPKDEYMPLRLDIHFMGAVALSEAAHTCTSHYSDNQHLRLVPSYGRSEEGWHGFLITVPRADWRANGGLGLIYFDRVSNVDPEGEELPDPWHVYPTRQVRSGEPVEQQDFSVDVPDDDNLWTNDISQVYITIANRERWENAFYKVHSEARDKWAREELARRKAKKKAEEADYQRLKYTPVGLPEEEYRHAYGFQDLDGRMGLSYYEGRFDIRPYLSFQVYVTYNTSDQETDKANLAAAVYKELIHEEECIPVRLDIHFLGAVPTSDTASTCVAHYRAAQKAHAEDPNMRLVPSYALYDTDWHGFLVTVPRADWREHGGLGLVYFDRACEPPTVAPGEEEPPDPKYIYPTRKVDPSKPPIESQLFTLDVPDDDILWTNTVMFVYTHIKVKEDWENMYYVKEVEARENWAREELARRKAKRKKDEEAGHEAKKEQPPQE